MSQFKFNFFMCSLAFLLATKAQAKGLDAIWKNLKPGDIRCYQSTPIDDYDSGRPTIENMGLRLSQSPATNHPNEYYAEISLNYSYISDRKHQYQKNLVFACESTAPFACHIESLQAQFEINTDKSIRITGLAIPESCDLKDENQVASCQKLLDVWHDIQTLRRLSENGKAQWWPQVQCK